MIKQKKQQDTDADCSSLSATTRMQPFYFPYHDRSHHDNDQQLKRRRKRNEHRILNDRLYQMDKELKLKTMEIKELKERVIKSKLNNFNLKTKN